ncbi:IS110 family transposase [Streptomyces hokutonensis]|uniref:IS110 family transposase n=1 Tax=Streptomyces hokutonensis TaxID=1306990 RepID=UPI000685C7FB
MDLNAGGAALWIARLVAHNQRLLYIPGCTVHHASAAYRGSGKADAIVIVDTARMRRDLQPLQEVGEIAANLRILTARRIDLSADRTLAINRLRAQLLEYFPTLERALDPSTSKSALILLSGFQIPAALRRIGRSQLATWLKNHGVRTTNSAKRTTEAAVTAAEAQFTVIPGEKTAAKMVHTLAREVLALDQEIADLEALIEDRFREHPDAMVITSMPGIGMMLGAEFIAATGGDMSACGSPDRLTGGRRRPGTGSARLGHCQRKPPQAPALQPTAAAEAAVIDARVMEGSGVSIPCAAVTLAQDATAGLRTPSRRRHWAT